MNEPDRGDNRADPIDTLLRAHAPAALPDDGFVARTMLAVARADATPARAVRPAPLSVARALVLEQRRYATQARLWRWAMAGVAVGALLLVVAVLLAPGGGTLDMGSATAPMDTPPGLPLWTVTVAGAIWFAWNEFRAD